MYWDILSSRFGLRKYPFCPWGALRDSYFVFIVDFQKIHEKLLLGELFHSQNQGGYGPKSFRVPGGYVQKAPPCIFTISHMAVTCSINRFWARYHKMSFLTILGPCFGRVKPYQTVIYLNQIGSGVPWALPLKGLAYLEQKPLREIKIWPLLLGVICSH